jgi:hypothetical protein
VLDGELPELPAAISPGDVRHTSNKRRRSASVHAAEQQKFFGPS